MKRDSLAEALNPTQEPAPRAAVIASPDVAEPVPDLSKPPSRRGTKAMTVHVDPAIAKELRLMALHDDSSLQALLVEAVNDYLLKRGKPPIA